MEEKTCRSCGRRITWRKKWERDWELVTYCSSGCRSRGVTPEDRRLEELIRELVVGTPRGVRDDEVLAASLLRVVDGRPPAGRRRPTGGQLSPQEVVRRAARRLVADDEVELVQGGRVVDPSTATGPVLIRRRRP